MSRNMHTIRIKMQAALTLLFIMMLPAMAQEKLSKEDAEGKRVEVINAWKKTKETQFRKILEAKEGTSPTIYNGNDSLPFWYASYGNAPLASGAFGSPCMAVEEPHISSMTDNGIIRSAFINP